MESEKQSLSAMAKDLRKNLSSVKLNDENSRFKMTVDRLFVIDSACLSAFLAINLPRYQQSVAKVLEDYPWIEELFQECDTLKEWLINPKSTSMWLAEKPEEEALVIFALARKHRRTKDPDEKATYQALMNQVLEFHERFTKILSSECPEGAKKHLTDRLNYIRDLAEGVTDPEKI